MSTYTNVHEIVRQLCDWHTHREPYTHETNNTTWVGAHITQVPPLVTQLIEASPSAKGDMTGAGPCSRPAANIEALDTYTLIDLAAARWVRDLGEDDPADTIACIRKLYGLLASAHRCGKATATTFDRKVVCCTTHAIERDIRSWWTQAKVVSGWDVAAWAPNNTCPLCNERRTLRIRVDDQAATCTNCRSTWNSGTIGLLADHVRGENGDEIAS